MKRILFVSPVGEVGGAEQVLLALARRLPAMGFAPAFALMRPGPLADRCREIDVPCVQYIPHRFRDLRATIRGGTWLAQQARQLDAAILHSNHAAHLYGGMARRKTRLPELWHLHDFPHRPELIDRAAAMFRTDHALFTTRKVASGFPRLLRGPHSVVYPICLDPAPAAQANSAADAILAGLPDAAPIFLTVTRLQEHKGHPYLIDAAAKVVARHPEATFLIAGRASGPAQQAYADALAAQIARLGLGARVKLLGYVADDALAALYRRATALVHPAITEGFGLTIIDAMARRLPVIAADADGPAEIIRDGQTGLLCPRADAAAIADRVLRLLADAALRGRLADAAFAYAATLSADNMVRQTADVYQSLLAARRTP